MNGKCASFAVRLNQATDAFLTGRLGLAEQLCLELCEKHPAESDGYHILGLVYHANGDAIRAASAYGAAIVRRPDHVEALHNLGRILAAQGRYKEAVGHFQKAVSAKPDSHLSYLHLGNALARCGNLAQALVALQQAHALAGDDPEICCAMADLQRVAASPSAAVVWYERALSRAADNIEVLLKLGQALMSDSQYGRALSVYERVYALDSADNFGLAGLVLAQEYLCDWRHWDERCDLLINRTLESVAEEAPPPLQIWHSLHLPFSAPDHKRIAEHWIRNLEEELGPAKPATRRLRTHSRLRIGYRSLGYRDCATCHLIQGLFEYHNRSNVEVYAYSYGSDDGSHYRRHMVDTCDKFIDVDAMDDATEAESIAADGIDILVDLSSLVGDQRIGTLRHRPARIQVSWLGLTASTGSKIVDYSIVDEIVVPLNCSDAFTEKLIYMPHSYMISYNKQKISPTVPTRSQCDLPENSFIFCCFNQPYKIHPHMFEVWMRILMRVPNSILWLIDSSDESKRNLQREAKSHGVACDRLIFSPFLSKADHLARTGLADLFLDTSPVNAHTTASDALWAGVPILTCPGETFVSRVSASVLHAVGLSELIVADLGAYENLAVRLATSPNQLNNVRSTLWKNRTATPLFDTPRFVRDLERAYVKLWEFYNDGESPRHIFVRDISR